MLYQGPNQSALTPNHINANTSKNTIISRHEFATWKQICRKPHYNFAMVNRKCL